MDYDLIASLFLTPPAEPPVPPVLPQTPARRLRDALEPLATHGWWCRPVNERLAELGLDFMTGYVWGRAAALGEPAPAVVVATFAVFEPGFLSATYVQARAAAKRDDVLRARLEGTVESLAAVLGDVADEAGEVADRLAAALARLDGAGRPLFSGLRELAWPADPLGRLWRAAELVREHRGDGHVASCVAAGLDPVTMNVLTELWLGMASGSYLATRGYGPDALAASLAGLEARGWVRSGALTAEGRAARGAIEEATDQTQADLVAGLGEDLEGVVARVSLWSQRLVDAGAFPPDPYKRAAG